MASIADLDRRFYADVVNEHVVFDRMIASYLRPDAVVLDAGAGRGFVFPYEHRNHVARLVGADLDPAVAGNPNVSHAVIADLARIPMADDTFDLAFSKNVFEHLDRPLAVLRELHRVLKPGAHLLIHTPNRWHYVTLVSALTPTRIHVWYRAKLGWGEPADTFPTRYRANDVGTIERFAVRSGFHVRSIVRFEGPPSYLAWNPLAYRLGIAYERSVNRFDALAPFRVNLFVDLEAAA
jgi:SAM-dependent methyltransferase